MKKKRYCGETHKIRYHTREQARLWGVYLKDIDKADSDNMRVYKCPFCKSFHLTSKPIIIHNKPKKKTKLRIKKEERAAIKREYDGFMVKRGMVWYGKPIDLSLEDQKKRALENLERLNQFNSVEPTPDSAA